MILSVIMSRNLLIFEAKIRRFWLSRPSKLPQMDQDPPLKLSIFDFKTRSIKNSDFESGIYSILRPNPQFRRAQLVLKMASKTNTFLQ
jgi:hypothetical protein